MATEMNMEEVEPNYPNTDMLKQKIVRTRVTKISSSSSSDDGKFENPDICRLPPQKPIDIDLLPRAKMIKEFACEYPSVEPNVFRTREPMPFPEKLHDLISWTDAFVDRIASMTQAEEMKNLAEFQRLNARLSNLDEILANKSIEIVDLQDKALADQKEISRLQDELNHAKADTAARDQTIEDITAAAALREAESNSRIDDLTSKLGGATTTIENLTKALEAADKHAAAEFAKEHKEHMKDHDVIYGLKCQIATEEEKTKKVEKNLAEAKAALNSTNSKLDANTKTMDAANKTIKKLNTDVSTLEQAKTKLELDLKKAKDDLDEKRQAITLKNKAIEAHEKDVKKAQGLIAESEKKVKGLEAAKVKLEDEKKKLTSDLNSAKNALSESQKALEKAKTDATTELEKTKTDVAKELEKTKTELSKAQQSLKLSHEDLTIALADLKEAKKDKKEAKKDKKEFKKKFEHQRDTHQAQLEGYIKLADGKVSPAMLAEAQAKAAELDANIAALRTQAAESQVKAAEHEATIKSLESKIAELQAKIAELEFKVIPWNSNNHSINILTVSYGGYVYAWDKYPDLFWALYNAADHGKSFPVSNSFFGNYDPWEGKEKTCAITYTVKGKENRVRTLTGREYTEIKFEVSN
jgi:chromosome segregation ATPase